MKRVKWLCLFFILVSCASSAQTAREAKPELLKQAQKAVLLNKEDEISQYYSRFLLLYPQSSYVGEAYYQLGLQALRTEKFDRARRELNEAVKRSSREQNKVLSLMALARAWHDDPVLPARERHSRALKIYEDLWERHRSLVPGDEICFQAGECSLVLSRTTQAKAWFQKLTSQFPRSKRAQEAKDRGLTEFRLYSVQVGAFGRQKNAQDLMARLESEGFQPFLVREKNEKLYFVRVGQFRTFEAARKLASRLVRLKYSAFLVP